MILLNQNESRKIKQEIASITMKTWIKNTPDPHHRKTCVRDDSHVELRDVKFQVLLFEDVLAPRVVDQFLELFPRIIS